MEPSPPRNLSMDTAGSPSGCNGIDDGPRAFAHITTGKDAGHAGLLGFRINRDQAPFTFDLAVAGQKGKVRSLANGQDHLVCFHRFLRLSKGRAESSFFIKHTGACHQLDGLDLSVFSDDAMRTPGRHELDALLNSLINLP